MQPSFILTPEKEKFLRKHWRTHTTKFIAVSLGASVGAINRIAGRLGLPAKRSGEGQVHQDTRYRSVRKPENENKPVLKTRDCLSCGEPFESEGAGNRICKTCKDRDAWTCSNPFETDAASFGSKRGVAR